MLVTMDFPDALTGGLRRTTDIVRGILEKTRADLTLAITQKSLEKRLTLIDTAGPIVTSEGKTANIPTIETPR
jgi:translin